MRDNLRRRSWLRTPARVSLALAAALAGLGWALVVLHVGWGVLSGAERLGEAVKEIGYLTAGGVVTVLFLFLFIWPVMSLLASLFDFSSSGQARVSDPSGADAAEAGGEDLGLEVAPADTSLARIVGGVNVPWQGLQEENIEIEVLEDIDALAAKYEPEEVVDPSSLETSSGTADSRSFLGTTISMFGLFLVWSFFRSADFSMAWTLGGWNAILGPIFVLVVVVGAAGLIASWLRERAGSEAVQIRQGALERILQNLRETGDAEPFVLYLRPFAMGRGGTFETMSGERRDFEGTLANAVTHLGTLVAVGRPDTEPGAAKLTSSDETWQEQVDELLTACTLVLSVPGSAPGLSWELQQIERRRHLSKTIFLRPASMARDDWDEAVELAGDLGWIFPPTPKGASSFAFVLGPDKKPVAVEPMPDFEVREMRDLLSWLSQVLRS